MQPVKSMARITRKALRTRWSPGGMKIRPWMVSVIVWATCLRVFAYSFELLFIVTNNPIGPMMAFVAVLGIQMWGLMMLSSLIVLIIGLLSRRSMIVTVGALLCCAVWTCFTMVLGIGWIDLGSGGRFFASALATTATFGVIFQANLNTYRLSGVDDNE